MGTRNIALELTNRYPLDRFLPGAVFDTHPNMPAPHTVVDPTTAAIGLTLDLAARHVAAERLADLAAQGNLNLQVLLVPAHEARPGYPAQHGQARTVLGLKVGEDSLTLSGSRGSRPTITGSFSPGEPTSEIRYARQEVRNSTVWRPDQAAGLSRYMTYGVEPVPLDGRIDSHNYLPFDRLGRVAYHLGVVVAGEVHEQVEAGYWEPQVLLNGQLVAPQVPAAVSAAA